ncbi:MAG: nucleotidyl transferase AbiEii/AbiGii toxin family protein [bacterium]
MAKTILSPNQKIILDVLSSDDNLRRDFYLTGGTALSEYYLHHRLSEDLDFFSEKEFDPQIISVFFKKNKSAIGIRKIAFESSFNRNLFFLHLPKSEIIKTEFTYFPFPRIEKKKGADKLAIDGILDIAVNKIFTIYQKPRSRDFIDLYFILKKTGWRIEDIVTKAKIKFDWHIDYLQLGSKFLLAKEVGDRPRMLVKINDKVWQNFFVKEAKNFKSKILVK